MVSHVSAGLLSNRQPILSSHGPRFGSPVGVDVGFAVGLFVVGGFVGGFVGTDCV